MKIICTQENLNYGLFIASHITSKNVNLPILNNILIEAQDNLIKLISTNLEIGISCVVRGRVEENGSYTVQAKLLSEYINLLPKEKIDLSTAVGQVNQESQLEIKCKNHATKIKGMLAADFPLIPKINKEKPYICKPAELKEAISQVIFAVSVSETRPEINGILFNFNHDKLILVATDSYRLAEKTLKIENKGEKQSQRVIVPSHTLQELLRILGSLKDGVDIDSAKSVEIYVTENQILFALDSVEITSRLIEGQYPDYQQIIPKEFNTRAEVAAKELVKVTKTASLFARSGIYDVNLELLPKPKEIVVSATNSQLGENTSRLSAHISGEQNSIVLNYRYLLDGLQNIDDEEIKMEIIDGSNPCIIRPKKNEDYLYIIMPIKQ